MTLLETLDQSKHSLFRFEYLQAFSVNSEKELWSIWQKERRIADEYMQQWWNYIANKKSNGITMQRVSLVEEPMTEYKEMELEIFKKTLPYGDDIRIISKDSYDELSIDVKDFWLIDDATVVNLDYDDQGEWLGFKVNSDSLEYKKAKELLIKNSINLNKFTEYLSTINH